MRSGFGDTSIARCGDTVTGGVEARNVQSGMKPRTH